MSDTNQAPEENFTTEDEIDAHRKDLNMWTVVLETLTIPESRQGTVNRFVRDCNTLLSDMDENETPGMADLVDFTDRRNSLEIQYLNITNDLK